MSETIAAIAVPGKGILAADESVSTASKRLTAAGVDPSEENRRRYREMLFTGKDIEKYLAGVILFEETLAQKTKGIPFPDYLLKRGILPGIKVDQGLHPLEGTTEQVTEGLKGLNIRLRAYRKSGACFAKWRAVYQISEKTPSDALIHENAERLAKYASVCQSEDFVPIVEPEVLIDGDHSIARCAEVSRRVLKAVFAALRNEDVDITLIILKPSMVISGKSSKDRADAKTVAKETIAVLKETVSKSVPTINFLSGGQSPVEATCHLSEMHKLGSLPWNVSFSYARALQEPALDAWKGKDANNASAQATFVKRLKLNSLASTGQYTSSMEE